MLMMLIDVGRLVESASPHRARDVLGRRLLLTLLRAQRHTLLLRANRPAVAAC